MILISCDFHIILISCGPQRLLASSIWINGCSCPPQSVHLVANPTEETQWAWNSMLIAGFHPENQRLNELTQVRQNPLIMWSVILFISTYSLVMTFKIWKSWLPIDVIEELCHAGFTAPTGRFPDHTGLFFLIWQVNLFKYYSWT